jgi:5-methylcytosine-specific restriction endonuclease McrA
MHTLTAADATNTGTAILQFFIDKATIWSASPHFGTELRNWVIGIAVFIFVTRTVLSVRRAKRKRRAQRTERMFNKAQKDQGHARAGRRCEFSEGLGRCKNRSEHGDHFYPHSRGGATTMKNFVAACSMHNLSKGAKMPSALEKSRIEKRRKRYFPAFTSTKAGEWA